MNPRSLFYVEKWPGVDFRWGSLFVVTGAYTSRERFHGRKDVKIFFIFIVAENTGSVNILYEYIFNALTCILNCKDSTDNKIPWKPYSEKEKKETTVDYFSNVLWNIRIQHHKTSVHWNIHPCVIHLAFSLLSNYPWVHAFNISL